MFDQAGVRKQQFSKIFFYMKKKSLKYQILDIKFSKI